MPDDACLAVESLARLHFSAESHVLRRRRKDAAAGANHRSELLDRLREITRRLSQRGEQQVANRMTINSGALVEPVLQQILEMRIAVSQCQQAITRVTRRQDSKLSAQSSRASAIVRDSDDSGQRLDIALALLGRELREAFKHGRQTGAATQRDDAART